MVGIRRGPGSFYGDCFQVLGTKYGSHAVFGGTMLVFGNGAGVTYQVFTGRTNAKNAEFLTRFLVKAFAEGILRLSEGTVPTSQKHPSPLPYRYI